MRALMEGARNFHAEHSALWERVRAAELERRGLRADQLSAVLRDDALSQQLWAANGVAYRAAEPHEDARSGYLARLAEILPRDEEIASGDPVAIERVLDFLEIRVPAFRCGYWKEAYYKKLRGAPLSEPQRERLRSLFLDLCAAPKYERELALSRSS